MKNIYTTYSTLFLLVAVLAVGFASGAKAVDLGVTTGSDVTVGVTSGTTATTTSVAASSKTSASLTGAVDTIVGHTKNSTDGSFCTDLASGFSSLSQEEKDSIAWKKTSYLGNVSLMGSADLSADEKARMESLQDAYTDINSSLDGSIAAGDYSSARAAASIRSAYLDILREYRDGTPDKDRIASLEAFIHRAKVCVGSDEATANLGTLLNTTFSGSSTTATPEESIVITAADIDADTKEVTAASVKNADDLKAYYKGVIKAHTTLTAVTSDSGKVETTIKRKGKLFAFIPVSLRVKTTVSSEGDVSVRYPWYSFLVRKTDAKVTTEMVHENLTEASFKDATLSRSEQALQVEAIIKSEIK